MRGPPFLSLSLLVLGVFTDDPYPAMTPNNLALFTNLLYRTAYFHYLSPVGPDLPAPSIRTPYADPNYVPTQKSKQIVVPLIDFKFLLGLIIAALSLEWFIRKYNGLT